MLTLRSRAFSSRLSGDSSPRLASGFSRNYQLNNDIRGTNNSNILDGGSGRDRLRGRGGNDTYYVDNTQDVVVEADGEGIDRIRSSVDYSLQANVENLTLIGNAEVGRGNSIDNDIRGNNQNNTLEGQGGQDELTGTLSFQSSDEQDILTGGSGGDGFYLGSTFASYYQSSILNNNTALDSFLDQSDRVLDNAIAFSVAQIIELTRVTSFIVK